VHGQMKRGPRVLVYIIRQILRLLLNWSVSGRGNVPADGPLVVICNHVHLLDPLLLICTFPRWITFMAKEELFRYPVIGPVLRWGEVLPVARGGSIAAKRDVLRKAESLLKCGHVIALFPEGKRSHTGILLKGKAGAGVLAARTDAPVLPIAITGTEKLHGLSWLWKRPRIDIVLGKPIMLPQAEGYIRSDAAARSEYLMRQIAALLPPDRRGPYAD